MHLNIAFLPNAQNVGFSRSSSIYRVFRNVWSIRSVLIQALTCCVTEREAQGAEKGSAEHQTKVRSCGCALFFCTDATSDIMRGRYLMCESRVLPCPQGSAEWQKGETREEGGHALRGVRTQQVKKSTPNGVLFFLFKTQLMPKLSRCKCRLCQLPLQCRLRGLHSL